MSLSIPSIVPNLNLTFKAKAEYVFCHEAMPQDCIQLHCHVYQRLSCLLNCCSNAYLPMMVLTWPWFIV